NHTFFNCSNLSEVTIPDGVTSIGEWAFVNCSGLTSITIPDAVTSIGNCAFSSCSGLTAINIPYAVTLIDNQAFAYCRNLTRVDCYPQTPPTMILNEISSQYRQFEDVSADCKIYVPTASVDAYKAAEGWSSYADKIVGYDF
ncbi:MAG: leucine-rich repeat domain-containing protein, partial [Alistipes sp.]|nr:leucine-rich repeat domain-containing protein [Alistipes sp.]